MEINNKLNYYQQKEDEFFSNPPGYPKNRFSGKGIVICSGGEEYFTCAWVCIKSIRRSGCVLPIELWYLDSSEWNAEMESLVIAFNVTCINASSVTIEYPVLNLINWELKPYAILHCRFKEVLYIDSDNFAVQNPEFLFYSEPYKQTGSLFWPDRYQGYGKGVPWLKREAWPVCRVPFRDETEFETGQLLIDKEKCWYALNLCMHYNEHSDFYYYYFYGDKDTFHLAWRKSGYEYTLMPYPNKSFANDALIVQFDFEGEPLFQHRNGDKWSIHYKNQQIPEFKDEKQAFKDLEYLKNNWVGFKRNLPEDYNDHERKVYQEITSTKNYECSMEGAKWWMQFMQDYEIFEAHGTDKKWSIRRNGTGKAVLRLTINGMYGQSCQLWPQENGKWSGWWNTHKREKIEITPMLSPVNMTGEVIRRIRSGIEK